MPHQSPRKLAATIIARLDPSKEFAKDILASELKKTDQPQKVTDLVLGTTRNRTAIDTVITACTGRPVIDITAALLGIIRVGVYEILYLPQSPTHAIVNEAVETAKTFAGPRQAAFVNAAMRQVLRKIEERSRSLTEKFSARALPADDKTACCFISDIFPNPEKEIAAYLAAVFSLPDWLINEWLRTYGKQKTIEICFASNRRPSLYIRPNIHKTTPQALMEALKTQEIPTELADNNMLRVDRPAGLFDTPQFKEGLFTVQDLAASLPVAALEPKMNSRILDLCAAPGTKTTQIAELVADNADIIATDLDFERLKKITQNKTRLGLKSINVTDYRTFLKQQYSIEKFDFILLDVPCSNTGVLSRRPEARFRIDKKSIDEVAAIQMSLLKNAAELLKPNGKLCYSTCSIQPTENELLIKKFLAENPSFKLVRENLTIPACGNSDHDGGYYAIISRTV